MSARAAVYVALDTTDIAAAEALVAEVRAHVGGIKLGLEFFAAHGPEGVRRVTAGDLPFFLDLKLHDIPNTVAGAMRAVLPLAPALVTVHAGGGPAMMRAAAAAAAEAGNRRPKVIAVTVLTSLDNDDLVAVGQNGPTDEQAERLAGLARVCGLDGIVCSPRETSALRQACGPEFTLVVPGIRPAGSAIGDQKRVMAPADAVAAGADVLVVGRPITAALDPAAAARAIAEDIGR